MKPGEIVPARALLLERLYSRSRADLMSRSGLHPAIAFVEMVQQERARQDEKWGEANYAISLDVACTVLAEEFGEFAQAVNDLRLGVAKDDTQVVVELVQTAAVAQSIYEQVVCRLRQESRDGKCRSSDG